jgi:hypothetical protein
MVRSLRHLSWAAEAASAAQTLASPHSQEAFTIGIENGRQKTTGEKYILGRVDRDP